MPERVTEAIYELHWVDIEIERDAASETIELAGPSKSSEIRG